MEHLVDFTIEIILRCTALWTSNAEISLRLGTSGETGVVRCVLLTPISPALATSSNKSCTCQKNILNVRSELITFKSVRHFTVFYVCRLPLLLDICNQKDENVSIAREIMRGTWLPNKCKTWRCITIGPENSEDCPADGRNWMSTSGE